MKARFLHNLYDILRSHINKYCTHPCRYSEHMTVVTTVSFIHSDVGKVTQVISVLAYTLNVLDLVLAYRFLKHLHIYKVDMKLSFTALVYN